MWKRLQVDRAKKFVLQLCQSSDGGRRFVLTEADQTGREPDCVFETGVCDNELLWWGNLVRIAETTPLTAGDRFYVDAHGVWLTSDEMRQIEEDDLRRDHVQWCRGIPRRFAPK